MTRQSGSMHPLELIAAHANRAIPGRVCGTCTLCCKVVSVSEINKPKGVWCRFARSHKGCDLYPKHPLSCEAWACAWLSFDLQDSLKPDRCHVVVDVTTDTVVAIDNNTGESITIEAPQFWLDEKYPNAWKEEPFKTFLIQTLRASGMILLRRWKDELDTVLFFDSNYELVEKGAGAENKTSAYLDRKQVNPEVLSLMRTLRPTPLHQPNPILEEET